MSILPQGNSFIRDTIFIAWQVNIMPAPERAHSALLISNQECVPFTSFLPRLRIRIQPCVELEIHCRHIVVVFDEPYMPSDQGVFFVQLT
jgi:hypothetical protein